MDPAIAPVLSVLSLTSAMASSPSLSDVCDIIGGAAGISPLTLAGDWDNVGLLLDSTRSSVRRIFCTNDLTEAVLDEALNYQYWSQSVTECGPDLIIVYHSVWFSALKRLTLSDTAIPRTILRCAHNNIAVYSPHSALDAAGGGINDWIAKGLANGETYTCTPIFPAKNINWDSNTQGPLPQSLVNAGDGRLVTLEAMVSLSELVDRVKNHFNIPNIRLGLPPRTLRDREDGWGGVSISTIGVCAGHGSILEKQSPPAQAWVAGELSHHQVLAAVQRGIYVILTEHSNCERGYLPVLRQRLLDILIGKGWNGVDIVISKMDRDPLFIV